MGDRYAELRISCVLLDGTFNEIMAFQIELLKHLVEQNVISSDRVFNMGETRMGQRQRNK